MFDNNLAPDHRVEDILKVMAKQLGFGGAYSVGVGHVSSKKKRGRPVGSLGKNKNTKDDDIKSVIVNADGFTSIENSSVESNIAFEEQKPTADLDKVCYDYNPASLNLLKRRFVKEYNQEQVTGGESTRDALDTEESELANMKEDSLEELYSTYLEPITSKGEEKVTIVQRNSAQNVNRIKIRISCPDCDKSYSRRSELNRHISSTHIQTSC